MSLGWSHSASFDADCGHVLILGCSKHLVPWLIPCNVMPQKIEPGSGECFYECKVFLSPQDDIQQRYICYKTPDTWSGGDCLASDSFSQNAPRIYMLI